MCAEDLNATSAKNRHVSPAQPTTVYRPIKFGGRIERAAQFPPSSHIERKWSVESPSAVCIAIHAAPCRARDSTLPCAACSPAFGDVFPPASTVPLLFAPAEAVQVYFGTWPAVDRSGRDALPPTWFRDDVCRLCRARHSPIIQTCSKIALTLLCTLNARTYVIFASTARYNFDL